MGQASEEIKKERSLFFFKLTLCSTFSQNSATERFFLLFVVILHELSFEKFLLYFFKLRFEFSVKLFLRKLNWVKIGLISQSDALQECFWVW